MSLQVAFLFPGQGSQSKGMLDAFTGETVVEATLQEASDALGYDMAALIRDDAEGKLDKTEYTQPALLTASTAMLRVWQQRQGAAASHVAGHSLGEYSALVAAGAIGFADAVKLVAFRGQAMSEAVPAGVGLMAAILGLDDTVVEELCGKASSDREKVWAANYNCPGQLVVAGHAAAVERLMEAAKGAGAKRALPLAVSAPSHTPLMQPAADAMRERLAAIAIQAPACPIWSNADAAPKQSAVEIREALVAQLVSPVRWTQTVQNLAAAGIGQAVEIGPNKVLAGLVKRIDRDMSVTSTNTPEQIDAAVQTLSAQA